MGNTGGILLVVAVLITSCVGTDYENDPIVGERITVSEEILALMPGSESQITAHYYDQYGIERSVPLIWTSSMPTVASVSSTGLITANSEGQATIQPSYGGFDGPEILVNVVSDPTAVASVEITLPSNTILFVGETLPLEVTVRNIIGEVLVGKVVEWFSEDISVLTVSSSGEIEGINAGMAGIYAKSEGVKSNTVDFTVSGLTRTGTFVSANGHHTSGTATLAVVNNQLILTLSNDFDTDFPLDTYIYLANSTDGSSVRLNGFEVAEIFADGGQTFNITSLDPTIQLNDYNYVISFCFKATVTFGYAELK